MVAPPWHDSLKQKHVCFTAKFACDVTLAMLFVQPDAESAATKDFVLRTLNVRAIDLNVKSTIAYQLQSGLQTIRAGAVQVIKRPKGEF